MSNTASVIIPAYNSAATLRACLEALKNQSYPPHEIIVVNDGSTDETALIAAEFDVILLSQPNAGQAAARNLGALAATGDILLFTDADCRPCFDWVEKMLNPFDDQSIIGTKGVYQTDQPQLVARFVQQEYQDRYDRMLGQAQIDFVDTYSAAYRREVFLANDGFDPILRINEDQEFSFRLASRGYRLVFQPEAVVYHQHKTGVIAYAVRKFLIGYWKPVVMRQHPAKLKQDSHTPQTLKMQMGLTMLGVGGILLGVILRRRWLIISGLGAGVLVIVSGLGFLVKIWQRDSQVLKVAPLLLLVRAASLSAGFLAGLLSLSK